MGDLHPHQLHKLVRSWLLAEDPYGMNDRQEPSMPDMRAPKAGQAAVEKELAPPPDPRARPAGEAAVEAALGPDVNSEAFQGARNPRARAQGEQAVDRGTGPDVSSEAFQGSRNPLAQGQGEGAVDRALTPPMGGGTGFWPPAEAADMAGAVGQNAVAGAISGDSIRKRAKKRLADPRSEDDVPSE